MRTLLFVLLLASCDPVNSITVRFPVDAPSKVIVHWVQISDGRSYAQGRVFKGEANGPELSVTRSECCGTAAAYRNDDLGFIACVEKAGADPVLICGKPGSPQVARAAQPGTTCDALDRIIFQSDIDVGTCTLAPSH